MAYPEFERLVGIINALRHPETGCPWDLEQDHQSLLRFLIEETYEFVDATEKKDDSKMEEELGDVLLQVLLHGRIADERKAFNIESIAKTLADKMVRRHPHVFDRKEGEEIQISDVKKNWESIKATEKIEKNEFPHRIDNSYLSFPSLFSADKIGHKTSKVNFDWEDAYQVTYKVEEEWQELKEELKPGITPNPDAIREEMGDFLFSAAQLARHLGIPPEEALRDANRKFIKRFNQMELLVAKAGLKMEELSQQENDVYWNEAKRLEKM